MFINGEKYSERTKAVAREHLEMLKEHHIRYEEELDNLIMELNEPLDEEHYFGMCDEVDDDMPF